MIHRLKFSVTFPSTNQTFQDEHHFQTGSTAITGGNERGKSLRLEMIRYALFGTSALRAEAGNYKDLSVELSFSVNGTNYYVSRKKNKVFLAQNGNELATGGKPVNRKINEILGFDRKVFDVTNACLQGEVEALSDLRPAERKHLVDQTIGLTTLDNVVSRLKERENAERKNAEAIERYLEQPEPPQEPSGYQASGDLQRYLDHLQESCEEYDQLKGWLDAGGPVCPVYPSTDVREGSDELQAHEERRKEALTKWRTLESERDQTPWTEWTHEQLDEAEQKLDAHERWEKRKQIDQEYPGPGWELSLLRDMKQTWERIAERKRVEQQIEKLERRGTHVCSNCGHEDPLEKDRIEEMKRDLPEPESEPALSMDEVRRLIQIAEKYETRPTEYDDAEPTDHPGLSRSEISKLRSAVDRQDRIRQIDEQLSQIEIPEDRSQDLKNRLQYEHDLENYHKEKARYDEHMSLRAEKEERIKSLEGIKEEYQRVQNKYLEAKQYEMECDNFTKTFQKYKEQEAEAQTHRTNEQNLSRARGAVKDLKARVKEHLVPSLNRVASYLISEMTGGVRSSVEIDEEWRISVDGQPVSTLSGSGKAVANLATRIALGQVLTNKVFPVFLGDEIDAAMDEERASSTMQCLGELKKNLDQIILVTHKQPETDKNIPV